MLSGQCFQLMLSGQCFQIIRVSSKCAFLQIVSHKCKSSILRNHGYVATSEKQPSQGIICICESVNGPSTHTLGGCCAGSNLNPMNRQFVPLHPALKYSSKSGGMDRKDSIDVFVWK